jgi:hypothetical protein
MRIHTYHEISEEDVGKSVLRIFGRERRVSEFMGKVTARDIGKRIFHDWVTDTLSVENDVQLRARRKGYGGRA